jgi:peptidoglycan/xylan/chitin deacetylase (PgdA/CDA1 family)
LLYGTLLPGPDIGKSAPEIMRRTRDEGFETGIHSWDHVGWQDGVQGASAAWTRAEMQRAQNRYTDVFKEPAQTHGAAGWQMSTSALRLTQDLGFEYCSDGRTQTKATFAHYPVIQGEIIGCAQLPTNLPTLDELIGIDGCTEANVDQALLARTAPGKHPVDSNGAHCHVFTLHAELEGGRLMPIFERLLSGWRNQGYELVTTRALFRSLSTGAIPYHHVGLGTIPGRSGSLLVAGARYTAAA